MRKGVDYSYAPRRQVARPSGLAEFLWSCVLDDYVSEEDDKEFAKIIGQRNDSITNNVAASILSFPCNPVNGPLVLGEEYEDPRTIRIIRGGSASSSTSNDYYSASRRDGTPAVWPDSTDDTHEAPLVWLAVPSGGTGVDDASEITDYNMHRPRGGRRAHPKRSSQSRGSHRSQTNNSIVESRAGSRASSSRRGIAYKNGSWDDPSRSNSRAAASSKSVSSRRSQNYRGDHRSRSKSRNRYHGGSTSKSSQGRSAGRGRQNSGGISHGRGRPASRGRSEHRQPTNDRRMSDNRSRGEHSASRVRSKRRGRSSDHHRRPATSLSFWKYHIPNSNRPFSGGRKRDNDQRNSRRDYDERSLISSQSKKSVRRRRRSRRRRSVSRDRPSIQSRSSRKYEM